MTGAAQLAEGKFKGPVRFYDGRGGWARQDFESIDNPRFGYAWQRENRKDKGRQWFMVDGAEVKNFDEADRLLALPPASDSPTEKMRRELDEFRASPKIGMATRALSEAQCNAAVGPFASQRATMQRADHGWHVGINSYADKLRKDGKPHPGGLYNAKTAAHEAYRSMYLWAGDREKDTGLQCALGKKCRACPILQEVEAAIIANRDAEKFGRPEIEVEDIDFAKTWTCIGHILQERPNEFFDGHFFTTAEDRKHRW
ncbi:hypothetical protein ACFSTI_25240 [Rhizorhabdus histidinilytica]|uniref:Uncharacterized protein n=1 Tax=Rhizorhabdus histidinilytica TaxID=439228 RepID=A0A1T5A731_9SPHN|nr:hypothetical protein [Rhizorhabdus histidinilytica]SKB30726.1 hypothetical protein SAMN06295920_101655 [Rhizorhabdus histidinilytica]